ncbi:TPA: hypothetical protein I7730_01410 [Vibrio vulnificus]|uniref:Secreted protein n=1 Tax=Vibrio vulnificus TaxID=672 RepID=A0A8H9MYS2_VIBVL|nr:hypothetical protein [Vibrio vulnificus]HAS8538454.1 hypothetical protein [Vibrio vulnificus]
MQLISRKLVAVLIGIVSPMAFALSTVGHYTPDLDDNGTNQTGREQVLIQEQTSNTGCRYQTVTIPAVTEKKRVCEILGWEDDEYDLSDWENKWICKQDGGVWGSRGGRGFCESCSLKTVVISPAKTTTKMVCE